MVPDKKAEVDEFFKRTSRALFQHKKKKVRNALLDSFHEIADLDKKTAKEIISKLDSNLLSERTVQLDPDRVFEISRQLNNLLKDL